MLSQIANALAQNCDLNLRAACVALMRAELGDNFRFFLGCQHSGAYSSFVSVSIHFLSVFGKSNINGCRGPTLLTTNSPHLPPPPHQRVVLNRAAVKNPEHAASIDAAHSFFHHAMSRTGESRPFHHRPAPGRTLSRICNRCLAGILRPAASG